ncbi:hypothetical protein HAT91_04364 [Dickeya solani]|nr:hypothetical protein HAT91_04364 [Dickeya solani]
MGIKYFTLLTRVGELKLAEAISTGKPLEITQMGVGDGAVRCWCRTRVRSN